MLRYLRSWFRKLPAKPVRRRTRLFVEQLEDRLVPTAVITTDLSDYAPGQTAVITGTGFQVGEAANISVVGSNGFSEVLSGTSVADSNGQFTTSFVVDPGFANTLMTITATGNLGDTAVVTCTDSGGDVSISGYKYNDVNQNGVFDSGDSAIAGWTVYLSTSPNFPTGVLASVTTDANGHFLFTSASIDDPAPPGEVQVVFGTNNANTPHYYVFEGAPTIAPTTGWAQSRGGLGANVTGDPTNGSVTGTTTAYVDTLTAGAPNATDNDFFNYQTSGTNPSPNDVSVTKTDSVGGSSITGAVGSAVPGNTFTYTITVSNSGPNTATNVSVTDAVPSGLSSFVWSGNGNSNVAGAISDTIASLAPGGTVVYTVTATVDPGATAQLVNTVTVSAANDTNPNNNTATDVDNLTPQDDVSVTKIDNVGGSSITGSIGSVVPGTSFVYTITVSNNGPSTATNIAVNDSVPAGLTSFVWSGNGHVNVSGAISDTIASLPVGGTVTYSVTAAVSPGATAQLTNSVTVSAANDTNPNNNSATDVDTLTPHVDLAVTKTDNTASYVPGASTTYTIVVTNNGPSAVSGATIVDTLPAQATGGSWVFVSATGGATSGTASGTGALNTTGNLPVGATLTYHETITISGSASGNLTNTVTVQPPAGVTDTNPNNNTASDTDSPTPQVDLGVRKTANVTMALPGTAVTYTITVTNYGPSTINSFKLVDAASSYLLNRIFIASTGTYNATTGIWTGLSLAKGQSITLTLKGKISPYASGIVHNVVRVSVPTASKADIDTNPANNLAFFDIGIPVSKRYFLTSYRR
jgi:uncharacterized repeat protein (TIGR01451 family)